MRMIVVRASWDAEAGVFVATSEDVPGLGAEASSLQELQTRLSTLVPELLEPNADLLPRDTGLEQEIPLLLISEQMSKIGIPVHG